MINLIRGELLKIRTTNAWWLFGLGALGMLALAFLANAIYVHILLSEGVPDGLSAQEAAEFVARADVVNLTARLATSGQFFGLLFVTLLGILAVTGEYHHQTATVTFLTTPRRSLVILAKLVVAALVGAGWWLVTTVINIPAAMIFLGTQHVPNHFGDWPVTRAILLNLLAYTLWGILGVGFGVLIRSQIAATVTAAVLYLVGTQAAGVLFVAVAAWLDQDWIEKAQVIVPSIASSLMISGTQLPGDPPQWVGAAVLVGYTVVTATIGTMIIRRRDVS
ncbi:MAG: ABC transporter permease subunit [Micromonosporaceae bacterium]|jgi:ABC-type transport system involved in multi-copper enzyme maturation permease subunit|nr:ABC transporter permease subunit [Micromonosporaceae bacterium]